MQCSAVQCSAVQCSAVQCSAVQCSAVQCSAVQCSAVQCSAVQRSAAQRSAAQRSAALRSAAQCSAVQCLHQVAYINPTFSIVKLRLFTTMWISFKSILTEEFGATAFISGVPDGWMTHPLTATYADLSSALHPTLIQHPTLTQVPLRVSVIIIFLCTNKKSMGL